MSDFSEQLDEVLEAIINACEAASVGEITPAIFEEMMVNSKASILALIEKEKLEIVLAELIRIRGIFGERSMSSTDDYRNYSFNDRIAEIETKLTILKGGNK